MQRTLPRTAGYAATRVSIGRNRLRGRIFMTTESVIGSWRMVEMELWDREAMDLVGPAMIEFARDGTGCFRFIAVDASLDYRASEQDGSSRVEFTWEGFDDGASVSGRGRAAIGDDGTLRGRIYFHMGDDSSFSAVRPPPGFTGRG